eukprot:CAMPEP_0171228686 /NCGR_PEP_ID=MMETSP0790-20130122/38495_1 /TAXON_ID=2925 /ORGANISM="Alexandrium catenella, Strain OF101" /LENGTH=119 /DNA_ID=CAMNT_0011694847 /DNA_START=31 /DNA_END=390 /DNA_ORIENTATION=-
MSSWIHYTSGRGLDSIFLDDREGFSGPCTGRTLDGAHRSAESGASDPSSGGGMLWYGVDLSRFLGVLFEASSLKAESTSVDHRTCCREDSFEQASTADSSQGQHSFERSCSNDSCEGDE